MTRRFAIFALGLTALFSAAPAHAQTGPVYVVPTRPGVPVVLHGRDVSYTVVEGDWGLARPGHVVPSIVGYAPPVGNRASPIQGIYHPRYGAPPPRGRNEVDPGPDRQMPEPAESFSRSWETSSEMGKSRPPKAGRPYAPPSGGEPFPRPQSYNSGDSMPATITDPQTFTMPPVIIDRRP